MACCAPRKKKWNISFSNPMPRSEKWRSGVLSFLGLKSWRLRYQETRQCFVKTRRPAAFLPTMAPQRICRHPGEAKEQLHIHLTNAESWLQCRLYLYQECHPLQLVTLPEFKNLPSSIGQSDIHIFIQFFPTQNVSMMMRILSKVPIFILTCWLMKVSTLSVVW